MNPYRRALALVLTLNLAVAAVGGGGYYLYKTAHEKGAKYQRQFFMDALMYHCTSGQAFELAGQKYACRPTTSL